MIFHLRLLLFVFLFFPSPAAAATPSLAKRGCEEWCGNVSIPFPFGIGEGCAFNPWFLVKCDHSSNPPKPYLNSFLQIEFQGQIVAVSLQDQTITTLKSVANFCDNSADRNAIITNGTDLSGSPFYYSKSRNKFLFGGCGNSLLTQNSAVLAGCTAVCSANITGFSGCYGYDCCETPVPFDLSSYTANFTNSGIGNPNDNLKRCNSAFLVDQRWIPNQSTSLFIDYAPVVWIWTVQSQDFPAATTCSTSDNSAVQLADGTSVSNFRCDCPTGKEGNPYITDGCGQACVSCPLEPVVNVTLYRKLNIFRLSKKLFSSHYY
nr:wall-associated receptor kinase-like 1 [Ipomoea batatas]